MASRKRERVGVVTEVTKVDGDRATVALGMAEAIATGLAVVPADMGAGAATGGVSVRADVGAGAATDFARHMASETAGVLTADKLRRGADAMLRDSGFDPPLNPALADDPGGWCVHAADWIGGRPVVARDAAGGSLCGLTEAEARLVVRVLGSGYTAAREV